MTRWLLPLSLSLALVACGPPSLSVRVEPIDSYRAYGEYHPAAADEAIVKKSTAVVVGSQPIRLFQEAYPEGITLGVGGSFSVAPGYDHRLLGKYAFSRGKEEPKDALVERVKQMCIATHANAALILFHVVPSEHQDRAQGIEAILIHLEEKPPAALEGTTSQTL